MSRKSLRRTRRLNGIEQLDSRICLAIEPVFDTDTLTLTITGTREADSILVQDYGRGAIQVVDGDTGNRWEFSGVENMVVEALEGDDTIRISRRGGSEPLPNLDINAGDGDDNVLIGLLLPAVQKVRDAAAKTSVDVDLGSGNNKLQVNTVGVDNLDLRVTAGDGDDDVAIALLLPAVQKVRDAAAASSANVDLNLGAGANQVRVQSVGMADVDLDIQTGDGDDNVGVALLVPAVQKVREAAARASVNVDLGDGNNNLRAHMVGLTNVDLDITAGDDDDAVLIGLLLPAVQKVREAAATANIDLGGGNDKLNINAIGVSDLDLNITAGDGDDAILIGMLLPAVQKVREGTSATVAVDLGPGADSLFFHALGYETLDTDIVPDDDDTVIIPGAPPQIPGLLNRLLERRR